MFTNSSAATALGRLGVLRPDTSAAERAAAEAAKQALLDDTANAAGSYAGSAIRDEALAALGVWAGTTAADLDEGESLADRLIALAVGVADENKDGEISDDEADVVEVAMGAMADYLSGLGVSDDDLDALFNGGSADVAARVQELLAGSGGSDEDIDNFLFDAETSDAVLDGILDAVYKKAVVVRDGKKKRIMKRVSGTVRLSAAQKIAVRKATQKARSAGARVRRMKSMKVRERAGL